MQESKAEAKNSLVSFRISDAGPKNNIVSFRITDDEKEQLEKLASEASISVSAMLRNVLLLFKENRNQPLPEIFRLFTCSALSGRPDSSPERATWSENRRH